MSEQTITVRAGGRVTIPASLRRELGFEPGRQLSVEVKGGSLVMRRWLSLDDAFGIIPALPGVETGDFDDLIEEAMSDHADWVVARMKAGLE